MKKALLAALLIAISLLVGMDRSFGADEDAQGKKALARFTRDYDPKEPLLANGLLNPNLL